MNRAGQGEAHGGAADRVTAKYDAEGLVDRGYLEQAELRLRTDLLDTPDDPRKLALLGRALLHGEKLEEARRLLLRAKKLAPEDGEILSAYGAYLAITGRIDDAREVFDRAGSLAPQDPVVLARRGLFMIRHGDEDEAEQLLRRSLEIDPDQVRARAVLGAALVARGCHADAIEMLLPAADCRFEVNGWLAVSYFHLGRYEEALRHAERELQAAPMSEDAILTKVGAQAMLGREEEAFALLDQMAPELDDPLVSLSVRAEVFMLKEDWVRAMPVLQELVESGLQRVDWHLNYARCLRRTGQIFEARDAYRHALLLEPGEIENYDEYADFCEDESLLHELLDIRSELLMRQRDNPARWLDFVRVHYRRGAIELALKFWQQVREMEAALPPALLVSRAQMLVRGGRIEEALHTARYTNELNRLDSAPFRLFVRIDSSGAACGVGFEGASQAALELIRITLPLESFRLEPGQIADYGVGPVATAGGAGETSAGALSSAERRLADPETATPGADSPSPDEGAAVETEPANRPLTLDGLLALQREATRPWTEVFRRSQRSGFFYVRHASQPMIDWPEDWKQLKQLVPSVAVRWDEYFAEGMLGGSEWTLDAVFLDGGVLARDGSYDVGCSFFARHGAWIVGEKALRLACYSLGLKQPRRFRGEGRVPSFEELCETIVLQRSLPEGDLKTRFDWLHGYDVDRPHERKIQRLWPGDPPWEPILPGRPL